MLRGIVILACVALAVAALEFGYRCCYVHPHAFLRIEASANGDVMVSRVITRHKRWNWLPAPLVHARAPVTWLGDSSIDLSLCGFHCNCHYGPAPQITDR